MYKIKLILFLLIVSLGVMGQDNGIIDNNTTKNPPYSSQHRLSSDGTKLYFRGFNGVIKEVLSSNNIYSNPSWITSLDATRIGSGTINNIEYSYLDGVTSAIQTQLNSISSNATHNNRSILDATTASYTTDEKNKLAGIATGATVNSADTILLNRGNHTGFQVSSTISDFQASVSSNTDVITAKSQAAQALLNTTGLVSGQNFISNWNASTNSPTLTTTPSANGNYYIVSVAGTQSITGSSTSFLVGDKVISNGTTWVRIANSTILADGSISKEKFDSNLQTFVARSEDAGQKFNAKFGYPNDIISDANSATFVSGGYFNSDGSIGTVGGSTYSYQSNYVNIEPSTQYTYTGQIVDARYIIFYDANKNVIGSTKPNPNGTYTTHTFTTPSNCRFIRSSCTTSFVSTYNVKYTGANPMDLYAQKYIEQYTVGIGNNVKQILLQPNEIVSDINNATFVAGGYYDINGNIGTIGGSLYSYQTNYVPVFGGVQYTYTGQIVDARYIVFYDKNKNVIGSTRPNPNGTYTTYTFTTPSDCKFIRCSCTTSQTLTFSIKYTGTESARGFADISYESIVNTLNSNSKNFKINFNSGTTVSTTIKENIALSVRKMLLFGLDGWTDLYINYLSKNHDNISGKWAFSIKGTKDGVANSTFVYIVENGVDFNGVNILDYTNGSQRVVLEIDFSSLVDRQIINQNFASTGFDFSFNDATKDAITYLGAGGIDYNITTPDYIFGADNNSASFYTREYIPSLYPESFVTTIIPLLKVNGSRAFNIQSNAKNTSVKQTYTKSWSLSADGYITKTGSVSYIKTRVSNAKGKQIRVLNIGDSICAADEGYADGTKKGGWGFPSILVERSLMDNKDFGGDSIKLLTVGTNSNQGGRTFTYNSQTFSVRSFSEGRGGWAAATYLRHPRLLTGNTTASTSAAANGAASWAALGLLTSQGVAYSNTTSQRELIATTVFGKNAWDYDSNIWDWLKAVGGAGWTGGTGSYTGSLSDKAIIDTAMEYIMNNPSNPFYSKTKAQTVGNTNAFSYTTYYNRYKTLQDDGITRLVVGSTAGSLVTSATSYDVCNPTHVVLELGENDRWQFDPTSTRIKNDLIELSSVLQAEIPNVHIGFMVTRMQGAINQADWSDVSYPMIFSAYNNVMKFNLQESLKTELGNITTQQSAKKWLIPTYYTMTPIGGEGRNSISLSTLSQMTAIDSDDVHPGILGHWSIADQIYSWILYTL